MIKTYANKETERPAVTGKSRKFDSKLLKRAMMRLNRIDAAVTVDDLRIPPSHKLEKLAGNRKGQYSIRINDQWRVCFKFEDSNAFEVEITDYH